VAAPEPTGTLEAQLEQQLVERHGVLMPPAPLLQSLGYASTAAFSQAVARDTVPVPVFKIAHRRGYFALTRDVALWLARLRQAATVPSGARYPDAAAAGDERRCHETARTS
jgi:hypothetical protein